MTPETASKLISFKNLDKSFTPSFIPETKDKLWDQNKINGKYLIGYNAGFGRKIRIISFFLQQFFHSLNISREASWRVMGALHSHIVYLIGKIFIEVPTTIVVILI